MQQKNNLQKINPKMESREKFDTRRVVETLENLMHRVTEKDVSSETVNAACNCADKITDILKVHLEVERMRAKFNTQLKE